MARLLFTADIHLRSSQPKCRTDDFVSAQWYKIEQIMTICKDKRAVWIDAGDLFHNARPPLSLLSKCLEVFEDTHIYTIPGNHDLPAHNMGLLDDSGIGVLHHAGIVQFLSEEPTEFSINKKIIHVYGCPYGADIPNPIETDVVNVLVMHEMFYKNRKDMIPNVPGHTSGWMLKNHPAYSLIVTGHNHKQFQRENAGRLFVNVGCVTRQAADYANHSPRVLLYNGDDAHFIELDHEKGVVSKEHIEEDKKKEQEMSAFVEQLQNIQEVSLSYEHNVRSVIEEIKPDKQVIKKVWEAMQ